MDMLIKFTIWAFDLTMVLALIYSIVFISKGDKNNADLKTARKRSAGYL